MATLLIGDIAVFRKSAYNSKNQFDFKLSVTVPPLYYHVRYLQELNFYKLEARSTNLNKHTKKRTNRIQHWSSMQTAKFEAVGKRKRWLSSLQHYLFTRGLGCNGDRC